MGYPGVSRLNPAPGYIAGIVGLISGGLPVTLNPLFEYRLGHP